MRASAAILGIGTATPPNRITQEAAAEFAEAIGRVDGRRKRVVRAMYARSSVNSRASVLLAASNGRVRQTFFKPPRSKGDLGPTTGARLRRYAQEAPVLAAAACTRALAASRTKPEAITHLVTVSCTGFEAPGVDIQLVRRLGLSADVERTHIGFMGCHGALNGLRVARSFAADDPGARVLVCAVELCSLHFQYGPGRDELVSNALFSDGAAACVVAGRRGPLQMKLAATGSTLLPDSWDRMSWRIGDHGFRMTLDSGVPSLIRQYLRPWLAGWLAQQGHTLSSVGSWAVHPGGPGIIRGVLSALDLPERAGRVSQEVLSEHGNMSSPTVFFILERLRRERAGKPYLVLAFGPGLTAEAALIT